MLVSQPHPAFLLRRIVLGLLVLIAVPAWGRLPRVLAVNCRVKNGQTRVRIVLSAALGYHDFSLVHPARFVIDLDGASVAPEAARGRPGCGAVRSIRRGLHPGHRVRYVLMLPRPLAHEVVPYPGPHGGMRLSLRIGHETPPAPVRPPVGPVYRLRRGTGPIVIAIDPGHGGRDPGTTGPHGLREKTVVLEIARVVAAKIDATAGFRAFLTRTGDYYVSLPRRVYLAQRAHAAVFVSIHANAFDQARAVKGGVVYLLSLHGASSAEARLEARAENAADPGIGGVTFSQLPQVNSVLTQMMQNESIALARLLGRDILHRLGRVEPLYERHVQQADFAVLRDPMIPSVLVETAFLSNPAQARDLHHRWFIDALAEAIFRGIIGYARAEHLTAQKVTRIHPPGRSKSTADPR